MLKNGERIEIYPSRKTAWLLLLGSAVFVAAGTWMTTRNDPFEFRRNRADHLMGYFAIVLFGAGVFVSLKQLIRPKPQVTLDEEGIKIGTKRSLTWPEVKRTYILEQRTTSSTMRYVAIAPKDPTPYVGKMGALGSVLVDDGEVVRFAVHATEMKNEALMELIQGYLDKYGTP